MKLRRILASLTAAVSDEAERNPQFREKLNAILDSARSDAAAKPVDAQDKKRGGRRTPAILDPVELARLGETQLRARLSVLGIEQLRDIVAQYGMDPGKLVMKWKDTDRVVDRVVELSLARATKGDVFRQR